MPRKAKKPQRLSISAQIAEVLRSSSDLGTRLTRILELAVTLLKGDGGKIYLVDPRSNRLVLKAIIGQHPGLPAVGTTLRLDEGMAGKVLSTQRPLLVEDYSTYSNRVRIWEDVFKSVIEVPLLFDNAALGVFSVFTEGATPPLRHESLAQLELFAEQAVLIVKTVLEVEEARLSRTREVLLQVTTAIGESHDLEAVAASVLDAVGKVILYNTASIQLLRDDKRVLLASRGHRQLPDDPRLSRPIGEDPLVSELVATGQPLLIANTTIDPRWEPLEATRNILSWIGIPLIYRTQVRGFLFLGHALENFYDNANSEVLRLFGNLAAIFLAKAETEREIRALSSIGEIAERLNRDLAPEGVFESIVTKAGEILACTHCTLFLPQRIDGVVWLVPEKAWGHDAELVKDRRFRSGEGFTGWAYQKCETILTADVREDPRYVPPRKSGVTERSMLVVPIKLGDRAIGVISADQDRLAWFDRGGQQLLEALAVHAGTAICRARALESLVAIGEANARSHDERHVLQSVVDAAVRITNSDLGVLCLLDRGFERVAESLQSPEDVPIPLLDLSQPHGLGRRILDSSEPHSPRSLASDDLGPGFPAGFRSLLGLRLEVNGRAVGLLLLCDSLARTFSSMEIAYLKVFLTQASIAIEKAQVWSQRGRFVFVMMPFGDADLDYVYSHYVKTAIEELQLECVRADLERLPGRIMQDIENRIRGAEFLIADLTLRNANVSYEVGIAHALRAPVILLTRDRDVVPSKLRTIRYIFYENSIRGARDLQSSLSAAIARTQEEVGSGRPRQSIFGDAPRSDSDARTCLGVVPRIGRGRRHLGLKLIEWACAAAELTLVGQKTEFGSRWDTDATWRRVKHSDVIVADITGADPDIFYVIGLAHGLQREVILIGQVAPAEVPFDLRGRPYLRYSPSTKQDDQAALSREVRRAAERFQEAKREAV